jgi:hypothetical protein
VDGNFLARLLMAVGAGLFLLGVVVKVGARLGLGRLPGDLHWRMGNAHVWVPLGTCLLVSLIATVLLNLFGRR